MRRILLATPYDLAVPGGANRQPLGLLDELERRGLEVRLVGPSSDPAAHRDPRITVLGGVARLPLNGATSNVTLDPRVLPRLRRIVAEFEPDVVHVQEPVVPLPCAALLWMAPRGALRVGTFHTYAERNRGYLLAWPWVRAVWSRLHVRVAVSEAAREYATRYHRAAFEVIPNAVAWPEEVSPPETSPGAARVLFVGRLDEPRKGFGQLLEALRRVEAEAPGLVEVTAVGRGGERWESRVAGLPVRLVGEVDDAGLAEAYRSAELVVVPSQGGESFGLVPLEAMAHGRPVVASRIAGYAAWLEDAAVLVSPQDAGALAAALTEMARDPAGRRALAARGREVARAYAWPVVAERWAELYGRGVGERPPLRSPRPGRGSPPIDRGSA